MRTLQKSDMIVCRDFMRSRLSQTDHKLTTAKGDENMPSTLTFITESLPDFTVGVPKQVDLEVSGGTPPYRFEITQGTLPRGLKLSIRGRISGVARRVADTTVFIKVTDHAGASLTQAFPVRVVAP